MRISKSLLTYLCNPFNTHLAASYMITDNLHISVHARFCVGKTNECTDQMTFNYNTITVGIRLDETGIRFFFLMEKLNLISLL